MGFLWDSYGVFMGLFVFNAQFWISCEGSIEIFVGFLWDYLSSMSNLGSLLGVLLGFLWDSSYLILSFGSLVGVLLGFL